MQYPESVRDTIEKTVFYYGSVFSVNELSTRDQEWILKHFFDADGIKKFDYSVFFYSCRPAGTEAWIGRVWTTITLQLKPLFGLILEEKYLSKIFNNAEQGELDQLLAKFRSPGEPNPGVRSDDDPSPEAILFRVRALAQIRRDESGHLSVISPLYNENEAPFHGTVSFIDLNKTLPEESDDSNDRR
jgi:hypothetical protein